MRSLAKLLIEIENVHTDEEEAILYDIRSQAPEYPIYGKEHIDAKALCQMDVAMRLPISVAGALMPDAHAGYGLPIGGVLATDINTIIPYAVGVDIACRMCMSIFDVPPSVLDKELPRLKSILNENTFFGMGSTSKTHFEAYKDIHAVMDAQHDLVEVLGTFMPKIVKMADPRERPED